MTGNWSGQPGRLLRILSWAPRGLALLLAAAVAVALLAPRHSWFILPMQITWVVMVLVLAGYLLGGSFWRWLAKVVTRRPLAAVAGGTAVGALLVLVHLPLALIDFGWDARNVLWSAERLAAGSELSDGGLTYFAKYPNNIPLLALESVAATIGSWVGWAAEASVLAAQTVGVVLMLWCLGATMVHLGRPGAVWPVQALVVLLVGFNPHAAIPYSDLPTAAVVSVALWAAARAWAGRGWGWWVVALVGLVAAMSLKPYAVALALGALAFLPALARRRGRPVALLTAAGAGAALGVGVMVVHAGAAWLTGLSAERLEQIQDPYPVEHFLAMGTYDSQDPSPTRVYGGWSWEHASAMKHEPDPEVRKQISREKIVRQVGERGILGNLAFTSKKVAWTWGDGTFWAHGEGDDREQQPVLSGTSAQVQSWFIGSGHAYQQRTAGLLHGVWLGTLVITAAGLWRARAHPWMVAGSLTLLVLTGYLALFETRPRYLLALLPVLIVLAGLTTRTAVPTAEEPAVQRAGSGTGPS